MPVSLRRIYFDACVLLAYIGNEAGRADIVQALLDEIEILTSVLSITEVAYGAQERDDGLTAEGEAAIDTLWTPASPITLVDISQTLAREARSIIRAAKEEGLGGIRSADAIHLASARLYGCDAIFTYEDETRRTRWHHATEIDVSEPTTNRPQLGL
jgi:predicted nucleic acid-binding protein